MLIPGENDSPQEIEALSQWIVDNLGTDVPVHFTAFHPDYRLMDIPATAPETLINARKVAMSSGLKFVYTGNIHDSEGGSTWCPSCGSALIERDWYKLGKWNLDAQGSCTACGEWIAGLFDSNPGNWGPKRQPVRLNR